MPGALASFVAALVLMVGVTGCGGGHSEGSRGHTAGVAETVKEAAEFGGLVIPAGVTVLDARSLGGLDTLYQVALSTDQQGLGALLTASKFSAQLDKVYYVPLTTIAGPPLDTSPSILRGGDRYQRPGGRSINRVIVVDERDSSNRYVHVQLFTT
ncbi:hypothetical protein D5S18_01840 [Nocardia panacis]|uniref:Uncharacterized protein n=1 Tax=Nocardia panacis TaxID=2340916 RepID=A0A3A4KQL4_9NOCA|nr:hypothetical protein [Nocardia panacis]RJO80013.1 hypothetical protein D5S18_01840 [Nocardia panacis]